jgi:uncharacterized protein involved in exopolysaccharide biosynthesis
MRDVLAVLFRHRMAIAITFAIIVLGLAASDLWKPQYEAQMKILVQRQRSDAIVSASPSAPVQYNDTQVTEEELNSEVELLNSRDLLAKVVRSAHLEASRTWGANDPDLRIAAAARQLGTDLKIEAIRKSHIILIRYQSRDPRRAAEVLQALASAYKEKHAEVHHPPGEYKFFDQETEQYRRNLELAQQQLIDFSKKSGVVSAQAEREFALQRADEFDAKSRQAEISAEEARQRIQGLEAQLESLAPRLTTTVRTSDNAGLLERLKNTQLELELKRTGLLTKYEPTYPLIQEVDRQIEETREAIRAEQARPLHDESTDSNPTYMWAREELAKLRAELNGLTAERASAKAIAGNYRETAQRLDQDGIVQQDLLRKAKMQEDGYLLYVHKREEAGISDALDQRRILNVAVAEEPVIPALPRRSPTGVALLTLLLAVTGSFSSAFLLDLMDPTFRTPDELAGYLKSPVLAALPKLKESR